MATTIKKNSKRNNLIQKIHIAKSQLHLDDETYRAMLSNTVGKTSCSQMDFGELHQVLEAMRKKGFKPTPGKDARRGERSPQSTGQPIDKIRAIWITMGQQGIIGESSEQALLVWIKRQSSQLNGGIGVDSLEWLQRDTHMTNRVLESLKKWKQRVERQWQNEDFERIHRCQKAVPDSNQVEIIRHLLNKQEIMWWPPFAELGIKDANLYLKNRQKRKGLSHEYS